MLTAHQMREIRRLRSQGLSTRKIAELVDTSRETVRRAINGEIEPREIAPTMKQTAPRRCAGCGGMVWLWPCLTCARNQQRR